MKRHRLSTTWNGHRVSALVAVLALFLLPSPWPAHSQGQAVQPVAFVKKVQEVVNGLPMAVPYLYVMNSDASGLRRVPNSSFFEEPALSPLADRIAVRALTDGGNVILLVHPTTGQAIQATANLFDGGLPATTVHDASFSPDGRYLVLTKALRGPARCGSDPECKHFLAYVDLNTIDLTNSPLGTEVPNQIPPGLIDAEHDASDPDWGPGGWIAYAELGDLGLDGDLNQHGLWRIRLGDTSPQQITSSPTNYFDPNLWANITQFDFSPVFSPAGSRIAYVKWLTVAPPIGQQTQYYLIYVVNADGSSAPGTRLFSLIVNEIFPHSYGESIHHLTWSPDGAQLMFSIAMSYDAYGYVNTANLCRISTAVADQTPADCAWLTTDHNGWPPSWGRLDTVPAPVLFGITANRQVSGVVPLTVQAADGGAYPIAIRLYDNGMLIGQTGQTVRAQLSLTDTLTLNWDTAATANGTHTLRAEADDATGHTGVISATVSVQNPSQSPTPTPLPFPAHQAYLPFIERLTLWIENLSLWVRCSLGPC